VVAVQTLPRTQTIVELAEFNVQEIPRSALPASAIAPSRWSFALELELARASLLVEAVAHARLRALFAAVNVWVNLMSTTVEVAESTALKVV
jgi:hypothetical protein